MPPIRPWLGSYVGLGGGLNPFPSSHGLQAPGRGVATHPHPLKLGALAWQEMPTQQGAGWQKPGRGCSPPERTQLMFPVDQGWDYHGGLGREQRKWGDKPNRGGPLLSPSRFPPERLGLESHVDQIVEFKVPFPLVSAGQPQAVAWPCPLSSSRMPWKASPFP